MGDQINSIKPINVDTVHKICSGQVVLSLGIAVKELVENALDAGATNIDIRFKNHGIDLIEVADNGSGVTEDNFAALTSKYHTSKLTDYSDLLGVSSFGFRGEALSSLCALANMVITTRHTSCNFATKIEYDLKGNIVKKTPCSRQVGTTVTLTNLFHSLPVRQKEFHKNVKREFNKMTQLLYAYCLISLGVKITCSNQTSSNSKSVVVATQGSSSYKDNISCVFGVKQLQTILEIKPEHVNNIKENIFKGLKGEFEEAEENSELQDVEIDLSEDSNDAENSVIENSQNTTQKSKGYTNVLNPVEFTGFISSCAHGSGRSSTDRQFFYVNSRPCEPTKIIKLINETYKQYNGNQYPFVFLNVNIDRMSVDLNVTPDKRKIFMTKEKIILDVLKNSLTKLFESIPRTLKVESLSQEFNKTDHNVEPELSQPRIFHSFLQKFGKSKSGSSSDSFNKVEEKHELKRKSTSMLQFVTAAKVVKTYKDEGEETAVDRHKSLPNLDSDSEQKESQSSTEIPLDNFDLLDRHIDASIDSNSPEIDLKDTPNSEHIESNSENIDSNIETIGSNSTCEDEDSPPIIQEQNIPTQKYMYLESTENLPNTQIRNLSEVVPLKSHTIYCKAKSNTSNLSDVTERPAKKTKVATDKGDLGKHQRKTVTMKTSLEHVKLLANNYQNNKDQSGPTRIKFKTEINPVFNKKCEEELSREISKESFKDMIVIGQFNLGFIITKLEDDLFIIDQHATDEIYNFETLQKTTELTHQKLVIPQQLELTGVNEQILMDNLAVFKKNGFTFEIDENALPTKRVKLLTIPMSKNWIFGKEDIEELLFMLRESPSEYCRPSRVRAMFASRACRKSVMIGTALTKTDMKKLVDHMAEIDKPWNCPHGRPTIRHLVNLAMVHNL